MMPFFSACKWRFWDHVEFDPDLAFVGEFNSIAGEKEIKRIFWRRKRKQSSRDILIDCDGGQYLIKFVRICRILRTSPMT